MGFTKKSLKRRNCLEIRTYLAAKADLINKALGSYLPAESAFPSAVHQAIRYSVFAGGKRLRPILVLAAAEAVGGREEEVLPAACAIELIHTYSLIHDDLPAMDNDDFRRGKPTCHRVFGEAVAILAGDALLTQAFGLIARSTLTQNLVPPKAALEVIAEIAEAAGSLGLVGGQVLDLKAEGKPPEASLLEAIHMRKTAALFRAATRTGAILSRAKEEQLAALTAYGEHFGLAFQIIDDILNVTGDPKKMGKGTGSDQARKKATYPALYGVEKSRELAREHIAQTVAVLSSWGEKAFLLREIALFTLSREG